MFDGIDDIPWAQLKHAYGSADDVPDMLYDLASDHEGVRDGAFYDVFSNIFHQGDRYEATRYAVPFLLEILRQPDYPAAGRLLDLLTHLVVGFDADFVPGGFRGEIEAYRRAVVALTDVPERQKHRAYYENLVAITDEAREGVKDIVAILRGGDPTAAIAAARLLAFLPESSSEFSDDLLNAAQEHPDVRVRGNALIALALASSPDHAPARQPFTTALASDTPFLRACGAIALAILGPDEAEPVVDELLTIIDKGGELGEPFPWHGGQAATVATRCLIDLSSDDPTPLLDALEPRLGSMHTFQAAEISASVMRLLFPEPLDLDAPDPFNAPQRRWLTTLSRVAAPWEFSGSIYANFTSMIRSYNLPDSRPGLAQLLAQH